ncbi:MAG: AbrB family transcriptional regulator [Thermovirgaceae bacterium]|nr:AbrB family transcriptional regulator [Synergistales bacterium]HPC75920.1 AbrB family transcriptional regulator [Synergistales bacterium]HRS48693.1 AbrB family transcriptional regulator [Thermovirgaceae bacterium]HRU91065.1 AbrB family transcriptional regulator [Thermovirgaceae bacterium]
MDWALNFFLLFLIGIPGWLLLRAFRVPAAVMVGAMVSAAFFAVKGWVVPATPEGANLLFQVTLGLFVGIHFTGRTGRELVGSLPVALLAAAWWISFPLGLGWVVNRWFDLGLATSILGTVPGGIAEMSLLALTLEADAALVALMQFFRLSSVLIAMPVISTRVGKAPAGATGGDPDPGSGREEALPRPGEPGQRAGSRFLTLSIAAAGGLLFYFLGVPVGGFVGSMIFTAAAAASGLPIRPLPVMARHVAQLGLGSLIGLYATPETLSTIYCMFLTIVGTTAAMLAWGIMLAFIVRAVTGWSLMTCLIATCPGGITQLASIAEDLGADPLKVSLLHLARLLTIYVILPPLIMALV